MDFFRAVMVAWLLLACSSAPKAEDWFEPVMRMAHDRGPPTIALTFDACSGKADMRIIDTLVAERIPATIFVSGRWLHRNASVMQKLLAHPTLFQIENHGQQHLLASARASSAYGLKPASSPAAVAAEIEAGRNGIKNATGRLPQWYRGAGALYTKTGLQIVAHLGQKLAGYSRAPDGGAQRSSTATYREMMAARDGDVLLLHINHPEKPAGKGVFEAIIALKAGGYRFVRLDSPTVRFLYPQ